MKYLILACLLLSGYLPYSQTKPNLDSIEHVALTAPSTKEKVDSNVWLAKHYAKIDSAKTAQYVEQAILLAKEINYVEGETEALSAIGWINMLQGSYDKAEEIYLQMDSISEGNNYLPGKATAYKLLGILFLFQNDFKNSLFYMNESLKLCQAIGNKNCEAGNLGNIGTVYSRLGNYAKAVDYQLQYLKISEELGNQQKIANCLGNLGNIESLNNNYEKALEYYKRALAFNRKTNASEKTGANLTNMGMAYESLGLFEKALGSHLEAIEIFKKTGGKNGLCTALINLGTTYLNMGLYNQSTETLDEALGMAKMINAKDLISSSLIHLSKVKFRQNKIPQARSVIDNALKEAQGLGRIEYIKQAANEMAVIEKAAGNYKKSLAAYELYMLMTDSIRIQKYDEGISYLIAEYEFQKETDALQFSNEKEKLILDQQLHNKKLIIYGTISSIVILLVLVFILYRFYQSKKSSNILLTNQHAKIARQKTELESLDKAKSQFFTNISHDLRTPLTLILGPINQILNEHKALIDINIKDKLITVQKNAASLKYYIEDIMNLSRLQSNKLALKKQPAELSLIFESCLAKYQEIARQKSIDFQCNLLQIRNRIVEIDVYQTKRIIDNLLSNAFKFTPENGEINLLAHIDEKELKIEVKDNGIGIGEKNLPHIFKRYFMSDSPIAMHEGGTGIGLSLVKELVEHMKGQVSVKSVEAEGTTFLIILPLNEIKNTAEREGQLEITDHETDQSSFVFENNSSSSSKTKTVLIVEDHHDMQRYISSILDTEYQLIVCGNGQEALEVLQKKNIDLIISDIMMPVMNGFSLLETLKGSETPSGIPLIMLTALTNIDDKLNALTIGADDYITKPFDARELQVRVHNLINRYEARKDFKEELEAQSSNPQTVNEPAEISSKQAKHHKPAIQNKSDVKLVEEIATIIEANLENQEFRLGDLPNSFHLEYRQLRTKIKLITGLSPKKFQQEIAMRKARGLLENESYISLKAVAFSVGIHHVTRFSKMYIERFGKHPSSYFEDAEFSMEKLI